MAITRSDVENLAANSWKQLSDTKKDELVNIAERIVDNQLSADVATLPTVEGDTDDAKTFCAAHLFELAEGGEAQSEGSTGGNITYNTVTGDIVSSFSETRYGRTLRSEYLRDEQSIAFVRTR
jgi:hypothetical protein